MSRRLSIVAVLAMILTMALPAGAITDGSPDEGEHPYVGLMVAYSDKLIEVDTDGDGEPDEERKEPLWRCSGSLVSPGVFVTAGHCVGPDSTEEDADIPAFAAVWFHEREADIRADGYPWYEFAPFTGTPHPHPQYNPDAFFLFDVGVVALDGSPDTGGLYAELPEEGVVDTLGRGRNNPDATITAVGYGLQEIISNPIKGAIKIQADLNRLKADLMIVDDTGVAGLGPINPDQAFVLSGDSADGGTCFGDSGGPSLIFGTHIIVGVTSFGLNANCAGIGGAYRLDQADDLAFIESFLSAESSGNGKGNGKGK